MAEKQRVLRFCDNRTVKKDNVKIVGFFLRLEKTLEGWYLCRDYLVIIKGFKGLNWLPIDSRYAMPMSPYKILEEEDVKTLTEPRKVAQAAGNFTVLDNDLQQHKSHYYDFMGFAILALVAAVVIVALLAASGKVNIGALFGGK